jgi:glycosyltransferase involved in cell wall biosynthesis
MKVIVFDKFIGYRIGGAQNSLQLLLKNLKGDFRFLGCDVRKAFSAEKYKLPEWEVERVKIKEFPRWPYFEYWYNRKRVKKFIASQKADLLIAQGLWGAIAINAFSGKSIYFIRDEYHFNYIPVVQRGIRKFFKKIYLLLQWPFLSRIFKDNRDAILKADIVISNSKFVADNIQRIFNCESEIIYPLVDVLAMMQEKEKFLDKDDKFITSIGSEIIKGRQIVEKIAKIMSNYQFMIVGREFKKPIQKANILYYPWSKNIKEVYTKTKILLAPSIINEAFCRVALEGMALGIPCIGSNKGGIPEVLGPEFIINDVWDIEKWKEKILEIESHYEQYPEKLKQKSLGFDAVEQIGKFKKIIQEKLNINL